MSRLATLATLVTPCFDRAPKQTLQQRPHQALARRSSSGPSFDVGDHSSPRASRAALSSNQRRLLGLITWLSLAFSIGGIACDDDGISERGSAVFSTEREAYSFPPPSFESQSSELNISIQNTGAAALLIIGVTLEEGDDQREINILDEDDWVGSTVRIEARSERVMRLSWSVLDAQADSATLRFETNVGVHEISLTTPDIDPELYVLTDPELSGDQRGGRVELSEVPAGGVGRVKVTLQSIGAIELSVESLCFLAADNSCVEGDTSGSFTLCSGAPDALSACQAPEAVGVLLPGATKTLSVFYAPSADQIDAEVVQLRVVSDSGSNPSYLLTLQGSPCIRSAETPVCGGCGDGEVGGVEECDDGNLDDTDGCLNGCIRALCGDGVTHRGVEECDDSNGVNTDACTNTCELARCGDGFIQGDEACDDEGESANCDVDCTEVSCGDGVANTSAGESCDAGEEDATCNSDCTLAVCGDGVINVSAGDACDDGNTDADDGCDAQCQPESGYTCEGEPSTCSTTCGDEIRAGDEQCDDGNTDLEACDYGVTVCTVCDPTCNNAQGAVRFCGDGVLDQGDGEACDDGNTDADDGCDAQCQPESGYTCEGEPSTCSTTCGDEIRAGDEQCDDGNTDLEACDYGVTVCTVCDPTCNNAQGAVRFCGDGVLDQGDGEACDDGNTDADDGCDAQCQPESGYTCEGEPSTCSTTCGDEIRAGDEQCDDGNTDLEACDYGVTVCTVCDPTCNNAQGAVRFCGDGVLDQGDGEACDDGNTDADDGCDAQCQPESGYTCEGEPSTCSTTCGDEIRAGDEQCDDGNTDLEACDYGVTVCTVCDPTCNNAQGAVRFCGDGVLDQGDGEACDDGNTDADDGCDAQCQPESGYTCEGEPSTCSTTCGDEIRAGDEQCDDGNTDLEACEYGVTVCTVCDPTCNNAQGAVRFCGDGVLDQDAGEACDDGNTDADDGCDAQCQPESGYTCEGEPSTCSTTCGDEIRAGDEQCDDGNTDLEACEYGVTVCTVCDPTCNNAQGAVRFCGDGVLDQDAGEACDDGNTDADDGCDAQCQPESGYTCEGEPSTCTTTCGDEIRAGDEQCDDGNTDLEVCDYNLRSCTVCDPTCNNAQGAVRFCGDGVLDQGDGEACDDGNTDADDGCDAQCQPESGYTCEGEPSTCTTTCGDEIRAGDEECDDGNTELEACDYGVTVCTVCDPTCNNAQGAVRFCGDGVLDQGDGEACDDGNTDADDGCDAQCQPESGYTCEGEPSTCTTTCGDEIRAGDEQCDDGNTDLEVCDYNLRSCTVCDPTCNNAQGAVRFCGDGVLDQGDGEACDDGNNDAGDGCSAACLVEEGYVCQGTPSACTTICGDEIRAGDEQCDDGNTDTEDCPYNEQTCSVCRADCTLGEGVVTFCGDGALNGPETCDLGADNGSGVCEYDVNPCEVCNDSCTLEAGTPIFCGDGIVQPEFEDCDGTRGCSEQCALPCSPDCPPIEMITISPGSFTMGFISTVNVTIGYEYQIAKTELTVAHYQLCVSDNYCSQAGTGEGCNTNIGPPNDEEYPQNCITRAQLKTFATWVGGDLPSEAEWEYAGRLSTGNLFPWGNSNNTICSNYKVNLSDCEEGQTVSVCNPEQTLTASGICDLVGNVSEWVLDTYQASHTGDPADGNPHCPSGDCDAGPTWVLKGGSFNTLTNGIDHTLPGRVEGSNASPETGGRIVRIPAP